MNNHLISLMVFFPALGALLQTVFSSKKVSWMTAIACSALSSLIGFAILFLINPQNSDPQLIESVPWIGSFAITYEVAVDGIAAVVIFLGSVLFPIVLASEWSDGPGRRGVYALILTLQSATLGTACSQDLFVMFFFWALASVPIYFLIGIWGGKQREKAAFRYIVSSGMGNALLFASLVLVYYSVEPHSFLIKEFMGGKLAGKTIQFLGSEVGVSGLAFFLMALGLALRAPLWPLHGWFKDVAEEAPTSVFVIISSIILPLATTIFLRLSFALFPETVAKNAEWILFFGCLNLTVGTLCALAQVSLKPMMSYLVVAQGGFMLVGLGSMTSPGVVGALVESVVFGLGIAGFILVFGILIQKTGTSVFTDSEGQHGQLGGIALKAPFVTVFSGLIVVSLLGLPGLGGFVGHSLLFVGSAMGNAWVAVVSGLMILLSIYYLFRMYRHVFLGAVGTQVKSLTDLDARERMFLIPIAVFLVVFGFYPKPMVELIRPTAVTLLSLSHR